MDSIRAMFSLAFSFLAVGVVGVLPTVVIGGEYEWYSSLAPENVMSELGFYLTVTLAFVLLAVCMTYIIARAKSVLTLAMLALVLVLNPIGVVTFFRLHSLALGLTASGAITVLLTAIGIREYESSPAFLCTFLPYYLFSICVTVFSYVLFMLN